MIYSSKQNSIYLNAWFNLLTVYLGNKNYLCDRFILDVTRWFLNVFVYL
jgi:hypothetical protein